MERRPGRAGAGRKTQPQTKLEHTFMNDILAKMLFVQYPDLLKRFVALLLGMPLESITQFEITNPEIPPEAIGKKFCRLDTNMVVGGQRVDLEIQTKDEGDYPFRSLYYWARGYSSALLKGKEYKDLPRTVTVSILSFRLFGGSHYHSEFQLLETSRHVSLTDRQSMHYYELPKLPKALDPSDELLMWLALFRAKTEEQLTEIEEKGGAIMREAIAAYRHVAASEAFKEKERLLFLAKANEASAIGHATRQERAKWQGVVADKDAELADKDVKLADREAKLADREAKLADREAKLADRDAKLADRDALIAQLKLQLYGAGYATM